MKLYLLLTVAFFGVITKNKFSTNDVGGLINPEKCKIIMVPELAIKNTSLISQIKETQDTFFKDIGQKPSLIILELIKDDKGSEEIKISCHSHYYIDSEQANYAQDIFIGGLEINSITVLIQGNEINTAFFSKGKEKDFEIKCGIFNGSVDEIYRMDNNKLVFVDSVWTYPLKSK